jgi:integral membrane protein
LFFLNGLNDLMLRTPLGRLRALGMVEAVSFLLLLGVAMPLKYFAALPLAVKIAGWLHGLLFVAFCIVLLQTQHAQRWPMRWTAVVFIAALLPFGPFVIDRRLKNHDKHQQSQ